MTTSPHFQTASDANAVSNGGSQAHVESGARGLARRGSTARRAGAALWQAMVVALLACGTWLAGRALPPMHSGPPAPVAAGRAVFCHSVPQSWRGEGSGGAFPWQLLWQRGEAGWRVQNSWQRPHKDPAPCTHWVQQKSA